MVSDDVKWTRANLGDAGSDVIIDPVPSGAASEDFALLVSCHHVIMSRGSFGLWAAILAGGRIRMEEGYLDGTPYANDGNECST